ncbi:hypothetical protein OROMI_019955 [Orobanche minor]
MAIAPTIGFLMPLNGNLEEEMDGWIPKIPLSKGSTYVGRDCIPITDKRLPKEGTNPVVVRSKNGRKKLLPGEKSKIQTGDVLELIPGHYFFKYMPGANSKVERLLEITREKRPLDEESSKGKNLTCSQKRMKNNPEKEALFGNSNDLLCGTGQESEDIWHFEVSKDKLPLTFRLLGVKELSEMGQYKCCFHQ